MKFGFERLQLIAGAGATSAGTASASDLTEVQVMQLIEAQHRDQKKSRMMAERAQLKDAFRSKRTVEYKSTVDKLRSHGTRNAVIRDYHKRLM